jgi:hypothetical protein
MDMVEASRTLCERFVGIRVRHSCGVGRVGHPVRLISAELLGRVSVQSTEHHEGLTAHSPGVPCGCLISEIGQAIKDCPQSNLPELDAHLIEDFLRLVFG